jgi:hypothetical protein
MSPDLQPEGVRAKGGALDVIMIMMMMMMIIIIFSADICAGSVSDANINY